MIQCLQGEIKQYITKAIHFAKTDSDSMRQRKPVFLGNQLSTAFWKFKNIDLKCLRGKLFPPLNSLSNQLLTFGKTIRQSVWAPRFLTSEYSIIKIAKQERKDEREGWTGNRMHPPARYCPGLFLDKRFQPRLWLKLLCSCIVTDSSHSSL